jgi:Flp pilus assembly protein TadD
MIDPEAKREFEEGVELLRNDFAKLALPHFRKALEHDKKNPFYLSYLGLALASAQNRWDDAEKLCYEAVRMKRTQAELYLNLSEVYGLAGRKEDAVETLLTGLQLTRQDARLSTALRKLGLRRPPLLSFLDRKNFLNRQLGKLRHKVWTSLGREA